MLIEVHDLQEAIEKFSVEQKYSEYTSEEHETWRLATTALENVLVGNTAVDYCESFTHTGMSKQMIPSLERVQSALGQFDWSAIVVDGFIPPDVFMLLQAHSILPISKPIRARSQLGYTPIPDIIHEAAGHLPMLDDANYRVFLQRLGEIGAATQLDELDMQLYHAQKHLAELIAEETTSQILMDEAESAVVEAKKLVRDSTVSPARLVARFHWWTVEYGLIGPEHKIFGAGLLSSVAEASKYRQAKHERLSRACCERGFEIDHIQPIYYVADSWDHLMQELDVLESMVLH
ncbi:MAG: hypothetical protein OXO49_06185 [Gammaproteobacteria bacterium]|nr:hypothetical protein [Gammaproteobacteria bacterium]MDE0251891.1 hypothetical protein [Gammaproteobacteria bacterium]MDE0403100.1 hypothetical protein [Gammaproteobacteria bacterium]